MSGSFTFQTFGNVDDDFRRVAESLREYPSSPHRYDTGPTMDDFPVWCARATEHGLQLDRVSGLSHCLPGGKPTYEFTFRVTLNADAPSLHDRLAKLEARVAELERERDARESHQREQNEREETA